MDNVTHSLIGIALGHGLRSRAASGAPAKPGERNIVLGTAVLAAVFSSNAPDLDVLGRFLVPWAQHDSLGYLLQHRGYTHSFLLAPVLAAFSAWLAWWIAPKALRGQLSRAGLLGIALIGVVLHITADSWNDYGIHPFSPFYNRWFYGDFIFILEPMIWFGLLPLGIFHSVTRTARVVCALLWAGMLGAAWFGPVEGIGTSIWLSLWALAWLGIQVGFRRRPLARLPKWAPALLAVAITLLSFGGGAIAARGRVTELVQSEGGAPLAQLGTSPMPGNPLVWRGIASTLGPGGKYVARQFTLSLAPRWFDPPAEYFGARISAKAPAQSDLSGGLSLDEGAGLEPRLPGLRWLARFEGNAADLQRLAARYCRVRGILAFARFPYWRETSSGVEVGDLRYDRGGRGFSRVEAGDGENCPDYHAPWTPPISQVIPVN